MPICYKINVLSALKEKGYTTYRLRKEKLLSERTIQSLRDGAMVSWETISRLCEMLECQPGDFLEHTQISDN